MTEKNKEWTAEINPFNWIKYCAQIPRWSEVGKDIPPAPASVGIDPSNLCQLECQWCNSSYIRNKNPGIISKKALLEIADYLPNFTDHPVWGGVQAACIAGGGEPLTNPATQDLIDRLRENGIKPGLITNGILLDRFDLSNCEWAGVSVDAGTRETYKKLKGRDEFHHVIKNIEALVQTKGYISKPGKGHGVSYKFVMCPDNVKDIYQAAKIAKDTGCRNIHIRPYGVPYKGSKTPFSDSDIKEFRSQITKARDLESEDFQVYGVTHKFNNKLEVNNDFKECYSSMFSTTFEPPTTPGDKFNATLCCDRRGDPQLTQEDTDTVLYKKFWGSQKHIDISKSINPQKCERCIRAPHNRLYEKAILEDNLSYEFG